MVGVKERWTDSTDESQGVMGQLPKAVRPSRSGAMGRRRKGARLVDHEGELLSVPVPLTYVWLVLAIFTVLEAANDLFGVAGPRWFYDDWVYNVILAVCAALVLGRAAFEPIARRAWLAFGIALTFWFLGSAAWTVVYTGQSNAPYPTFADIFWLAWYPLVVAGIFFLIRIRLPNFELHRWMDGIAVTLLVLAVGFALVIQPVANHKTVGTLAAFVAFLYPILDVLLIGALLGIYGLLGWRPDSMWILIGLAIVSTSIADAVFAVQEAQARSVVSGTSYDFVWTAGAILIALAAWVQAPDANANPEVVTGMRAVALSLFAQALAIGIQIYAIFREVGKDERIVTIVVLMVASVQIILTRPRRRQDDVSRPAEAAKTDHSEASTDVVT
jgi:diguanylate cyclase